MAFAIPLLPDSDVAQTKIRRQVHYANSLSEQCGHLAHSNIVRRGEEHHITLRVICLGGIGKTKITDAQ